MVIKRGKETVKLVENCFMLSKITEDRERKRKCVVETCCSSFALTPHRRQAGISWGSSYMDRMNEFGVS